MPVGPRIHCTHWVGEGEPAAVEEGRHLLRSCGIAPEEDLALAAHTVPGSVLNPLPAFFLCEVAMIVILIFPEAAFEI